MLLARSLKLKTLSRKLLVSWPRTDKRLCRSAENFKVPLEKLHRLKARSMKLPALHPRTDKRSAKLVEDSKAPSVKSL